MADPALRDYEEVDSRLQQAGAAADAAEAHGFVSGVVCAAGALPGAVWQGPLIGELEEGGQQAQATARLLSDLQRDILEQLNANELEFVLLLPEDNIPLQERAESLGTWARGFLSGLGHGGLSDQHQLSEDTAEMLKDLGEISQVEFDFEDAGEEDEGAYLEIVEYLRMGVLMLNEELQPLQGPATLQ